MKTEKFTSKSVKLSFEELYDLTQHEAEKLKVVQRQRRGALLSRGLTR